MNRLASKNKSIYQADRSKWKKKMTPDVRANVSSVPCINLDRFSHLRTTFHVYIKSSDLPINWSLNHCWLSSSLPTRLLACLARNRLCYLLALQIDSQVIDWLTHWLTDRPTDWLTDWLAEWMNQRTNERPTDWLTDWLADWLTDWLTVWLPSNYWPIDWLTDWLTDWPTDLLTDRLIAR